MRVQFWGVRGSIPTPLSPGEVEAKVIAMAEDVVNAGIRDPEKVAGYLRDRHSMFVRGTVGGNTTCVSVDWPGGTVMLDCGSGCRNYGLQLMTDTPFGQGKGEMTILISHTHYDHMMGFPFFGPIFQSNTIHVRGGHENLEERFRQHQHPNFFPVNIDIYPAKIDFDSLEEGRSYKLPGGASYQTKELNHPGGCYGYRIEQDGKVMVFATDSEYKRENGVLSEIVDFASGADLFIFDSQYTLEESLVKEDWGHSTAIVGVDIAVRSGVKRLALFHHEPNYPDSFIRDLLMKARRYREINYPDAELEIFAAIEGTDLTL